MPQELNTKFSLELSGLRKETYPAVYAPIFCLHVGVVQLNQEKGGQNTDGSSAE